MAAPPAERPYKFLDYYAERDAPLFFGRERETEVLLSDVIAGRLVVLFARTGSGKSSLINAGVRPRLHALDYATYWIRVERDPVASVRAALKEAGVLGPGLERRSFPRQMEGIVRHLGKPVVLFFDQFEEFFMYAVGDRTQPSARARRFVADIAALYRNRDSGVHIVFSLREDFFVDLDLFRDEIPSIFHNDANLRLRPFTTEQAHAVIVQPAELFNVRVEEELVSTICADLEGPRGIEPAGLQIVCDTLWDECTDGVMRLADYRRLGGARRILDQRLEEDLGKTLSDAQIGQFERLLPELRTDRGTKSVRGMEVLARTTGMELEELEALIERLNGLRLVRRTARYGELYVEWTSDYLVERAAYLEGRVRAMRLRRLLAAGMARAATWRTAIAGGGAGVAQSGAPAEEEHEALHLPRADFEALTADAALLGEIGGEAARFLFEASLFHDLGCRAWLARAQRAGVDVRAVIEERIAAAETWDDESVNAVTLLGEVQGELPAGDVLRLLDLALERPRLAAVALEALGRLGTGAALERLGRALQDDALMPRAVDVLRRMRTPAARRLLDEALRTGGVAAALEAGGALRRIAGAGGGPASRAAEAFGRLPRRRAETLFLGAVERGEEMPFWMEVARQRGVNVRLVLRRRLDAPDLPVATAQNVVRLLGSVAEPWAAGLMRTAERRPRQSTAAGGRGAVTNITVPATGAVSIPAARGGTNITQILTRPAAPPPRAPLGEGELRQDQWAALVAAVANRRCLPILGPGVYAGTPYDREQIAFELAREYGYPFDDPGNLARVAQFLAVEKDPMFPRELLATRAEAGRGPLLSDAAFAIFEELAGLPLPLYLTTDFSDRLGTALHARNREAGRNISAWHGGARLPGPDRPNPRTEERPEPRRPLVYHLWGHAASLPSLVVSEDDHQDLLRWLASDRDTLPIAVRRALADSSLLVIGFDFTDPGQTALFRALTGDQLLSRRYTRLVVQPALFPVAAPDAERLRARAFVERYLAGAEMTVYWGSVRDFAGELGRRRSELQHSV